MLNFPKCEFWYSKYIFYEMIVQIPCTKTLYQIKSSFLFPFKKADSQLITQRNTKKHALEFSRYFYFPNKKKYQYPKISAASNKTKLVVGFPRRHHYPRAVPIYADLSRSIPIDPHRSPQIPNNRGGWNKYDINTGGTYIVVRTSSPQQDEVNKTKCHLRPFKKNVFNVFIVSNHTLKKKFNEACMT